ncbi:MAG: ABC transporter permease [Chloroflexota bacterium]|nr:MAG: ABC transporter permease [Chloroflexota bacterium]
MGSWVIARLTFHEASRRWVMWAALLLGLIFLIVFAVGFSEIHKQIERNPVAAGPSRLMVNEIFNMMFMAGLYVVNFLTIIMTVLTSVDTLAGEINTGTIHTMVSKPIRRWEIVMGKWLGFVGMLSLYLLFMGGGVIIIIYLISGYIAPNIPAGLAMMWVNMTLLLGISLMGGAWLSTLANGVLVFGLYGIAFIGGWIEQFGSFLGIESAMNIGIVCSLIMPSEAIWKRAAYEMQSPVVSALGGFSFFSGSTVPSPLMVGYSLFYAFSVMAMAIYLFQRRDL